jgi:bifunctional non-homologous end joining protein LigD
VAWSEPYFPLICRRVLNRDASVRVTFVVFDLLSCDGADLTTQPYERPRAELERLRLGGPARTTCETFSDGQALFTAVCELGLEGVVAKQQTSRYGASLRGWVKVKNPSYWRRESEIEGVRRSAKRRRVRTAHR